MSTITADASGFRLPTNVKPTHYQLTVKTDLDKLEFQGFETVNLDVLGDTKTIVFNASKLTIKAVALSSQLHKSEQSYTTTVDVDQKSERVTVHVPESLVTGSKLKMQLWFEGKLNDDLMGYYNSSYEEGGKKIHYSLTQFEPTAARRAFPCWDEPLLKATFDIVLISRANTVNLSNMPVASEDTLKGTNNPVFAKFFDNEDPADWKVTSFQTTPPMSTYIVAFANGPFEHLETSYTSPLTGKTRPLRVYATKDLIDQTRFGLEVGAKALPEYEKVFQIEYPLPKLDTLVAHDFDAGAMENWGLITGRTTAYCVDEKRADVMAKKQIASTQSHEVAHMWFGNITTMSWWDNLWLNEGFATLMGEVIILNKIFPEWKSYPAFYTRHTEAALTLDAKPSSHPIQVPVPNADDINQIFDALSYSKAASVLRMLSVYVGEEHFLKGVSIYLKKHLYANSVAEDLWMGVQEATGLDIPDLMNNWITKIGFPVLTVTETSDGIKVRQDRFLSTGPAKDQDNQTIWQVPLSILTVDANGKPVINNGAVLKEREVTYKLDTSKAWKINAGSTGVYRVLYTPERLRKLGAEAMRTGSVFSLPDRLALVSDAVVLASSGLAKTSGALTLLDSLRSETEYLAWSGISTQLGRISGVWWDHEPTKTNLDAFGASLYAPLVEKLGFTYPSGEDLDTVQLRTLAISQAATCGVESVVKTLRGWFDQYLSTKSDAHIPPDLIRITFTIAGKYAGKKEWEALRDAYFQAPTPTVKLGAIAGMVSVKDKALLQETLKFINDGARSQDVFYFFAYMGMSLSVGRETWTFLKSNYDIIYKRFEGNFQIGRFIEFATRLLNTEKDAQEVEAFFKDKDTSKLTMAIPQALDGIRARARWLVESNEDVKSWLVQWVQTKQPKA